MNRNLLVICGTLESGGAERVISILSKPFADAFNKVTIITWRDAPLFYKIDYRILIVSLPKLTKSDNDLIKCFALRNFVKKQKPSLVLSFLTPFNMLTLTALAGINIPIIVAERNDPRYIKGGIFVKWLRKMLYHRAAAILCQTESIKNYFKGKLSRKTRIIYNPITLPKEYIGKAYHTDKRNRIVTIGRLHPQKNHKLLIDAFSLFHKNHSDYTLTIYGKGVLQASLQKYIDDLGLTDVIELAGEHNNIKDLILDAKIFVMTSSFEGMPNALIEAMCLGLPCISTKVSGAVDLIENGINGWLVDSEQVEIADKMAYLVEHENQTSQIAMFASDIYKKLQVEEISKQWIKYLESKMQ